MPPLVRATTRRKTAAVPTRNPVNATGLKIVVAYFVTTKLIPQITAIVNRRTSVIPNGGYAAELVIAGGACVAESVIAES